MKRVLVTGANGFVGSDLCEKLRGVGYEVFAAVRGHPPERDGMNFVEGDFALLAASEDVLRGVDVMIHLAARVHVMADESPDPLAEFRKVNVAATASLARAAAAHGVRRFIYLSSIKVNCEQTSGVPFYERDVPNPLDPYAVSKWEAEQV